MERGREKRQRERTKGQEKKAEEGERGKREDGVKEKRAGGREKIKIFKHNVGQV